MKIELHISSFDSIYEKARRHFSQCISSEENLFLEKEIGVPLEAIILINEGIKIIFNQGNVETYKLEVCLALRVSDSVVGKYKYYEDEKGNSVDDSLVFN
jgi:hypothetical protein